MAAQNTGTPLRFGRSIFTRTFVSFALIISFLQSTITLNRVKGVLNAVTSEGGDNLHTQIQAAHVIRSLENYRGGKYFIYRSTNLTLPHIWAKAKDPHARPGRWGRQKWVRRFQPYVLGELRFLEALNQNIQLRTSNISEADFIVVPIPLSATVYWGEKSDVADAFHHLFNNEPYFREHPEKHVYIAMIERLFRADMIQHFEDCCGVSREIISRIAPGTLVQDFDPASFHRYVTTHKEEYWQAGESNPVFQRTWSLGYAHEASDPKYNLSIATYEEWKKKEGIFFYRTRTSASLNNSTQFRHALLQNNMTETDKVLQPSAIGYDVSNEQWSKEISSSKFCLVVRGDNPSSRSFFTAIRLGCLPVVVSNALPYFQPLFPSLIGFHEFSIMINEFDFLSKPAESLNNAIRFLSEDDTKKLINGLGLIQRVLIVDHPQSLFVPAFVHETIATMRSEVYSG